MILVLSGTKDGRMIIEKLIENNFKVLATTATEYGGSLIDQDMNVTVISQKLTQSEIEGIIDEEKIGCVIDATHPYAKQISENAINSCNNKSITYLRYERRPTKIDNVNRFKTYEEAIKFLNTTQGNILLTTGSNNIKCFSAINRKDRIYARVLPTIEAISKCGEIGLIPKQILGLQGPFSIELNKAIYKEYSIKHVVTKDSGTIGGTDEKIAAAINLGINIVLIERPQVDYTNTFNNIEDLINYLKKDKN
ncbi:cobalt-precorrin-6A reductase [Brassicibacter mesophilus]|uniref:cobalt-precorrin-6A reductase n=1 Tax=Brassicibacter mesophilus TaxID=745119 RepID=UPI003D1AD5EA